LQTGGDEGFPICHEVFAGNTQDGVTLAHGRFADNSHQKYGKLSTKV
jgi:hypothetical protein